MHDYFIVQQAIAALIFTAAILAMFFVWEK